jgi:hypothetical protein
MRHALTLLLIGACAAPPPPVESAPPHLRRLTRAQTTHVIVDLFGNDASVPPNPEPDARYSGLLAVGASQAALSPRGVEGYEAAAYALAAEAMEPGRRGRFVPCTPAAMVDADCAAQALAPFGRRAFRRPLSDGELAAFVAVSGQAAAALGDFWDGLEFGIAAILQSPDFLYRVELGEDGPDGRRFTDWELASRLSFLLFDRAPDDALLDAAEAGELSTEEGLLAWFQVMATDPRAEEGLRAWVSDWLQLARLDDLYKEPLVYLHMSDSLGAAMREETLRTVTDHVWDHDGDARALFTTRTTFLDRELATLYGVPAPVPSGFGRALMPLGQPRRGILGQGAFLALQSHPTNTSPTLRGKFLREVILCQSLAGAPAGVDTSIPPVTEEARTLRERVAQHLSDPGCAGCHEAMDPVGLAFEHFDGLGGYRTVEEGVTIDASGELDGESYVDAAGLAEAVRLHPELPGCLVRTVLRSGNGRTEGQGEAEAVLWLAERFAARRFSVRALLEEFVMSPLFTAAGDPVEDTL